MDAPSLRDERREYLLDERIHWPFPRIHLAERPDPWQVSEKLFERFEEAKQFLPTQGDIAEAIDRRVAAHSPEAVALVIVDGLSYYDLPDGVGEPYFVDGISITEFGYRAVVGKPSISRRLFALGYVQQLGFSYFDPEVNELSSDLYSTFSPSQMMRIKSFDEVIRAIQGLKLARTYLQITLAGLDQISHSHRDRPPKEHYISQILDQYHLLSECLAAKYGRVLVVLTADHGILWRDIIEGKEQIVHDVFSEDLRSPRYLKGSLLRPYGRCKRSIEQNYTLLGMPWLARSFRNNEWGVHGGISAWESLVPLLINET